MIEAWRRMRTGSKVVVALIAFAIAVNAFGRFVGSTFGGPSGPVSSSFATAPDGLSAWASLLRGNGHDVRKLRVSVDRAVLEPAGTLVVADPEALEPEEISRVATFVGSGGVVIVSGGSAWGLAATLVAGLEWAPGGPRRAEPVALVPEVGAARDVRAAGHGHWEELGRATEVLRGDGGTLLVVADVGAGHVVALADTSPLSNGTIDKADNAALATAIAGGADRTVFFAEAAHGYGRNGFGLDDLPRGWATAMIGLALAGVVWMCSRMRRFGPPIDEEVDAPPPRRAYVDAMAATIARAGSLAEAAEPLRMRARRRLAARSGVDAGVADDELRRAAARAAIEPDVAQAVLTVPGDADALLALGRAAARLEEDW